MKFLILAAFPPELEPFREQIRERANIAIGEVGVGLAAAAANASRLIAEHRPDHVLFTGTVGSTDSAIPLLQLISANAVELADHALIGSNSYLPSNYSAQYEADEQMMNRLSETSSVPLLMAKCYSPLAITASEELGKQYGRATQAHFESLELFGIAVACASNQLPWNSVSAVTNYVCKDGHEQWKQHHIEAAAHTAMVLIPCLEAIESQTSGSGKLQANTIRQ